MNLRQIEVFRAVMRAGSVTGAARMLHVSQPGVSRMLGHIELQLGVTLFERSRGRLRATPEADALHAQVEQVYRGVQRIEAFARGLQGGGGLALRVLASPSTALQVVPQAVAGLARQYPLARIYMESQLVREMVNQLTRQESDLAISTLPIDQPLLQSQPIGEWSLACVFPAGHSFGARRSVGLAEVLKEPLIAFSADTPQGQLIAQGWRAHGLAPSARLEVRSGQAACALVGCGAGVAIVDSITARAWARPDLDFRPLSRGPTFKVFAVRNANVPMSALATALVEQVRSGLRPARRAPSQRGQG